MEMRYWTFLIGSQDVDTTLKRQTRQSPKNSDNKIT